MTGDEYIREASLAMEERYVSDCVTHACRVAELLLSEERAPWIGRIREVIVSNGRVFRGPLIPLRYAGRGAPTWTTHYVCGSGDEVYDPLAGIPLDVGAYCQSVFGKVLAVETLFDCGATEQLLREKALRSAVLRKSREQPVRQDNP
jgi:hypothetical protein